MLMIKITVWALPHTKWRHYMKIITQNEKILYIGIDVHKDTYSLCCFDFFRNELSDEMTIKATTKAVIKYLEAIKKKHTEKFFKWVKTVQFSEKWMQEAFSEYLAEIYSLKHKIELMDAKIKEIAGLEIIKDKVDKLVCFSGIDVTTAVETAVEIHDFTRFATAAQFVSYLGLCPGEDSSGKTKNMLPLTKAGNKRVRALFCESAKAIKRTNPYGQKSKRILERQKNASPEIVAYADKATKRIRTKMKHLEERGKNYNVSSAAGARELACFVWGMMNGKIA